MADAKDRMRDTEYAAELASSRALMLLLGVSFLFGIGERGCTGARRQTMVPMPG